MEILVFAHRLDVGGSQTNALELMEALRERYGHEVVLFATPGPMLELVRRKGIRFIAAPEATRHPSRARMSALDAALRQVRPDVLHVWDWWQCLDAFYGAHLWRGIPMVVSDMQSEAVNRLLPRSIITTFGTPEFVDHARSTGRTKAALLLPPVDTTYNAPGTVDGDAFRNKQGVLPQETLLVTVSRLVEHLKGESLRRTIEAIAVVGNSLHGDPSDVGSAEPLSHRRPGRQLRYIIVGEGDARDSLQRQATETNRRLGREAVTFTGTMLDPRPAYAAADIVIGMGGSALRAMAFCKPTLVVGDRGFSSPFTPETAAVFYYKGLFGHGDGDPGNSRLVENIQMLVRRSSSRPELGRFSREFVVKHFGLPAVAGRLNDYLAAAAEGGRSVSVAAADGARTAFVLLAGKLRRRLHLRRTRTPQPSALVLPKRPASDEEAGRLARIS
jgi:glycosyltransferase involved in cell wall biosynthesis